VISNLWRGNRTVTGNDPALCAEVLIRWREGMRPGRSGCASRLPSQPSRRYCRWLTFIGRAGGRRSSHRSGARNGRLRGACQSRRRRLCASHRCEKRLQGDCKALKPDFLDVSGLRDTRDQAPRERTVMPAHLIPLCAARVPGPPPGQPAAAAPRAPDPVFRPEQLSTAASNSEVGTLPRPGVDRARARRPGRIAASAPARAVLRR